jgi:ATP-dependent DNA helicase PIF1
MPVFECLGALIIDEVSMVPPDVVDCVSNTLKKVRGDARPFGGVPVVFVSDLLQLPPVVSDPEVAQYYTDRYRSPYFFSADVFESTPIIPIELTQGNYSLDSHGALPNHDFLATQSRQNLYG